MDNTATLEKRPLRILILLNLEWNPRLGAVRVYHELAGQWRAAGHQVEHFSLSEAFPRARGSRAAFATRQILFAYKARKFVRQNAGRFDVIDALIGSLPMSKKNLGFNGLLVARSVGLYLLYDRFEATAPRRWPHRSRGKFLGRIFYRFIHQRLVRASDAAVRRADLINVPNESEADCLRREVGSHLRIMVEPYGLTAERRRELLSAAASASARLAGKTISFIGMWAARKGAHDWSNIIARVRKQIPQVRFRLLGTMVDSSVIEAELKSGVITELQLVSEYAAEELARFLSDCAVGIFPSYVEGFGLAVLEQLAAGIPTLSFDVPGPRDVLGAAAPELLVPPGDVDALSRAATSILSLAPAEYEKLSRRCVDIAGGFDWSTIAVETIQLYRRRLEEVRQPPVLFVQPFALGSPGGGARILRALLVNHPVPVIMVCTLPEAVPQIGTDCKLTELHLPLRPYFGRIERTRFGFLASFVAPLFKKRFLRRLEDIFRRLSPAAIHAIPHAGQDFYHAYCIARRVGLPFYVQVHDDFSFSSRGCVPENEAERAMGIVWRGADARFVISNRLGEEYCRRYGEQPYTVITDGLEGAVSAPATRLPNMFRLYFMGLFHLEYEENLICLLAALQRFRTTHPCVQVSVTLRCQALRSRVTRVAPELIRVLPFAPESTVIQDLRDADLLYLPLPFGAAYERLVRLSLSTKMITYIGSGVPILYHGPQHSAVWELLAREKAAFSCPHLTVESVVEKLCEIYDDPNSAREVAARALRLAQNQFLADDQRAKFWNAIEGTRSRLIANESVVTRAIS